ncbi:hypothetical protein [Paraglaciecola sp. L1A13]|uniref:hypothetical protein n=1 Tax=Paraglaciecola sp. L1A13 TaxID=2686359 RepID=UPI00131AB268|nr:hypothetical protein [Paraglaciecola sp. L1A13]
MNDIKKPQRAPLTGSIFELLHSFASKTSKELKEKKSTTITKLSISQQSLLKNSIDLKPLSAKQLAELKPILLNVDPSFSLIVQIVLIAIEHKKHGVGTVIVEDCARLISILIFNMSADTQTSIYFSLTSGSQGKVDLERFAANLDAQYKSVIRLQNEDVDESNLTNTGEPISPATVKKQQQNISTLGILWCLSKGRVAPTDVIEFLCHQYSKDIVIEEETKTDIALFLNQILSKPESKKLFQLIKYFTDKVSGSERIRINEQKELVKQKKTINSLMQELNDNETQTENYEIELKQLKEKIAQLENSLDSQQKLGTADVVHLKDDHNKVKSKTLNLLEEDVMPLLQTSLHALNKDTPKTHVAIHHIDLVLENIEGTIKWLKK